MADPANLRQPHDPAVLTQAQTTNAIGITFRAIGF